MRAETIALHVGYGPDPTTHATAVPIYQTAAYGFDSAEHGAALFNLEVEGHRYSRISNPTNAVLEARVAALEGGVAALSVGSGQAALHYAVSCLTQPGRNIVSVPQLYGTTHSMFAHYLPNLGIGVRFARTDQAADVEAMIDGDTRALYCESVGNPAGNIADLRALADVAHRHGIPLMVDNTVATPILVRPFDHGADIVVEVADEVHGRPRHHHRRCDRRQRAFSMGGAPPAVPHVQRARPLLSRPGLHRAFRSVSLRRALPQRVSAHDRRRPVPLQRLPAVAGDRNRRLAQSSGTSPMRAVWRSSFARTPGSAG